MKKRIIVLFLTLAPTLWSAQAPLSWPVIETEMRQHYNEGMWDSTQQYPVKVLKVIRRVQTLIDSQKTLTSKSVAKLLEALRRDFGDGQEPLKLYYIKDHFPKPYIVGALSFTGEQFLAAIKAAMNRANESSERK